MTIARFHPMPDVVTLREAMDRLFEDSFIRPTTWTGLPAGQIAVPVDLWETPEAYHLRADLPGLSAEDIDINVTADTVSISGELKGQTDVSGDGYLRQERRYGKFQRAFTLPTQLESNKIEATFDNGVLTLVMPKAEAVRPKQIKINAKTPQGAQK
ncbi:MAG TPA: Hsp20/alpha crystallin family protein [Candidatus Limnocylindria bacterium]|nr:Hsp20/alpha crystallin family protein [Candidatus Limnocylindria bacterium]